MAYAQQTQAEKIYDEVTKFEVVLHSNDGDSYDSRTSAMVLEKAKIKLEGFIKHLMDVPFQPDR